MKQIEIAIILKYHNKMNITKTLIVFYLFFLSCKKSDPVQSLDSIKTKDADTLLINKEKCYVTFKWGEKDIESYKKTFSNEGDFYTVMDDVNYYSAEGFNYLEKMSIAKIEVDKNKYKVISFGNSSYIRTDSLKFFDFIIYEKGKQAQLVKPIDIIENSKSYFSENTNQRSNKLSSSDYYTPKGYHILSEIKYDWDHDKNEDKIIVYDSIPSINGEGIGKRPLIALKGKGNNQFEFWFRNDDAIPCRSCSGSADPEFELFLKEGNLKYSDISLISSTIKNIEYIFDKNLKLNSVNLIIEEGVSEKTEKLFNRNKFGEVTLERINIKELENKLINQ